MDPEASVLTVIAELGKSESEQKIIQADRERGMEPSSEVGCCVRPEKRERPRHQSRLRLKSILLCVPGARRRGLYAGPRQKAGGEREEEGAEPTGAMRRSR